MQSPKTLRKGFETGRIVNSISDWEEDLYYYADKSIEERLEGLTKLIECFIDLNKLPDKLDKSVVKVNVKFSDENL